MTTELMEDEKLLTIGKYGTDGINLVEARERLMIARKQVSDGISPASIKRNERNKIRNADRFCVFAKKYLEEVQLAETQRLYVLQLMNEILNMFGNRLMTEITTDEIRTHCENQRLIPSTAIFVRDLIANVYRYAIQRGHKFANPVDDISNSSIATFKSVNVP